MIINSLLFNLTENNKFSEINYYEKLFRWVKIMWSDLLGL